MYVFIENNNTKNGKKERRKKKKKRERIGLDSNPAPSARREYA